jgi:uroporphyrin-III C-methyltransferase
MSVEQPGPESGSEAGPPRPMKVSVWRRVSDRLTHGIDARTVAIGVGLVLILGSWLESRSRVNDLQQQLVAKLAEADGYNKESRQVATQARDTLRDVEFKVGMLESRLAETQNQRLALEALYLELSRSRDERVLAEVEQILLLGSQQLQLAGNLKAALLALETADARLQRADSPQFTSLRRAIRRDIDRLKAAPYVDVVGMSVRLDNLAHQVDTLELAMYERPAEPKPAPPRPEEGAVARMAREAWEDLKTLIRVQRIESDEVPLLSPSQQFFLRENLRMRMLSARIALLAHDEAAFKADTRSAADWLQRYFDTKDKKVGAAVTALRQLSESDVSIDLPDISASLEAVRNQKLVREKGLR